MLILPENMAFFPDIIPNQVWEGRIPDAEGGPYENRVAVDVDPGKAAELGLKPSSYKVFALIAVGAIDRAVIAGALGIRPNTVGRHLRAITQVIDDNDLRKVGQNAVKKGIVRITPV